MIDPIVDCVLAIGFENGFGCIVHTFPFLFDFWFVVTAELKRDRKALA
jgi:hypothetical protein